MNRGKIAVVGFGLAGATLAKKCMERGYEVHVYDKIDPETPSKVAAGIINPLSISRKKPIWKAKEFATQAWQFYTQWDSGFAHSDPMQVDINDSKTQNDWSASQAQEQGFLTWSNDNSKITINQSGWIDTELLIETFSEQVSYFKRQFVRLDEISIDSYDYVVLATGRIGPDFLGPQFRSDLFRPVLGDILEVEVLEEYAFRHLEGLFIIPLERSYILGSTYIHTFDEVEPSPERANLLVAKAKRQGIDIQNILGHRTAVRPAIYDRMPILGHIRSNIYAFAGMGSRGLLHAPLAAEWLIDSWQGQEIPSPMNIERACTK